MGLDAVWQQCAYTAYQVLVWLQYEASVRPVLWVGAVVVIVSAWVLYKMDVRGK